MKLSALKSILANLQTIVFRLDNGTTVPAHAHITELGVITRHFIDCGGTIRTENKINFQLWTADDYDHRLLPAKLLDIITLATTSLSLEDDEVEVEWQEQTIGKYDLDWNGTEFLLRNTQTACLAESACGIAPVKMKRNLADIQAKSDNCCTPGSGCC